jgi:NAD(P)-dependent dehydrogenase (short-subunit alcohol dehydrogenase family)
MNKVFILIGASGYLGKFAVQYFLNKDYNSYYFFSRRELEFSASKKFYQFIIQDLTVEKNVENLFNSIQPEKDSVLFLLNTIGGYIGGTEIKDMCCDDWLKMYNLNLNSSFLISKYFIRLAEKCKGGSICFISALSSFNASPNNAAYNGSKNSLNFLIKNLALEGKKYNLSANAIAPFAIDSPENRKWNSNKNKLVSPEQICEMVQDNFEKWKRRTGQIIKVKN